MNGGSDPDQSYKFGSGSGKSIRILAVPQHCCKETIFGATSYKFNCQFDRFLTMDQEDNTVQVSHHLPKVIQVQDPEKLVETMLSDWTNQEIKTKQERRSWDRFPSTAALSFPPFFPGSLWTAVGSAHNWRESRFGSHAGGIFLGNNWALVVYSLIYWPQIRV